MSGSGLEELWAEIYAKISVTHMISGHAFSRAVRAHILTFDALILIAMDIIAPEEEQMREELKICYEEVFAGKRSMVEITNSSIVQRLRSDLERKLDKFGTDSRTGKLWVQYTQLVDLMRLFIRAERTGDWELHLQSVREMLPYFHAAGYLNYAKSARLYVQQMEDLQRKMPAEEFRKFTQEGFFTVRQTSQPWGGVWTDMSIEPDLMRQLKCRGGLTRGRGLTDSTLAQFVVAFPACLEVCETLEQFSGVKGESSEQHVELKDSRRKTDARDVKTLKEWLQAHPPWSSQSAEPRSLSTGIVGDEKVNCEQAKSIGEAAVRNLTGSTFGQVKLSRKDRVLPLAAVKTGVRVHDEVVPINTQQLFMRIVCVMKTEEDLKDYLRFELSPWPPSLFDELSMRKTTKSVIQKLFPSSDYDDQVASKREGSVVLDGGYLLHAVLWPRPSTFGEIASAYVRYVLRHFGSSVRVVFDGYGETSTKSQKHLRRSSKTTPIEVVFDEQTCFRTSQADFLCLPENKIRLVDLSAVHFHRAGISVSRATADADTLIVKTAMDLDKSNHPTTVVATDTDILVMLIARAKEDTALEMLSPGFSSTPGKLFNVQKIRSSPDAANKNLLFVHAVTGCDTTSALY